jgi:hypothetical protein
MGSDIHVGAQHVDDHDFMAAILGRLDDAARRVKLSIA